MENLTLEEVMDRVDSYLTESILSDAKQKAGDAINKFKADRKEKKIDKEIKKGDRDLATAHEMEELGKRLVNSFNDPEISEEEKQKEAKSIYGKLAKWLTGKDVHDVLVRSAEKHYARANKLAPNRVAAPAKSNPALLPESAEDLDSAINDLKLRVYEAYDEGCITESDKDLMLEYLNLENYEEVRESFQEYISR